MVTRRWFSAKAAKILWLACAVSVFALTVGSYVRTSHHDISVFFICAMLLLTFPAGFLVAGLLALLIFVQEHARVPLLDWVRSPLLGVSLTWGLFVCAGYLQWFRLLPWLFRKMKRNVFCD